VAGRAFPPWFAWFLESKARLWVLPPATLVRRLPIRSDYVVAEIGSGTGVYARAVREHVHLLVGIDLQWGMLEHARMRDPPLRLVQGSANALPLRDESCDLIYLVTVLGELPDPIASLRGMSSALRPGGWLSISEQLPDPDFVPPRRLRRLCEAAGFRYVRSDGPWWSYTVTFQRPVL